MVGIMRWTCCGGNENMTAFVTAINCIDGRVQSPVSKFLKTRFRVDFVDMITCPGPVGILSKSENIPLILHMYDCVALSVSKHRSGFIAVVAHHDCAANDFSETKQRAQIQSSIYRIQQWKLPAHVIGLWVNSSWFVEEVLCDLTCKLREVQI
jgi:hypothetical protein